MDRANLGPFLFDMFVSLSLFLSNAVVCTGADGLGVGLGVDIVRVGCVGGLGLGLGLGLGVDIAGGAGVGGLGWG